MKKYLLIAAVLAAAVLPAKTYGQTNPFIYNNNAYLEYARAARREKTTSLRQMRQRRQQKPGAQNVNPSQNSPQNARSVPGSAPAKLTFIPAKSRILPGILAEKFGKTPQEKEQIIKQTVAEFDAIEKVLRERGRRLNDLSEMSAVLTQTIFDVYFGKKFDARQRQGVAAMFADYYSRDPEIQAMDDKQKQLYYELTLQLVRVIHTLDYFGNLDKKPQMVREAKQAAARAAESVFGTSIENLKLTAEGVEF